MGPLCFTLLLLMLVLVTATGREGKCGNNWCKCDPENKLAICEKHGRKLTYIPKLPKYVRKLVFSDNFLPYISTRTFENITSLRLLEMNITYTSIRHITPDAFVPLAYLKLLNMNGNNLSSDALAGSFSSLTKLPLSTLSLGKMNLTNTSVFRELKSHSLQTLILDRNNLRIYNHSDFRHLHSLQTLTLAHNYIDSVSFAFSSTLQNLFFRDNKISTFPNFCALNGSLAYFPNLKELKLDHNFLLTIDGKCIKCLKNLLVFSLNTNRILRIVQNTFSEMVSLRDLVLRNLHGNLQIDKYAFNNSNVQYISLISGGIHFKTQVHRDAFRGCTNITSLDVSHNVFYKATNEDFDAWFGHLTSLTGLGLGNCNIKHYPTFIPIKLKQLQYLKLYGNVMDEIPVGAFKPLSSLTHLWLTNNKIAKIDKRTFPAKVRERLQKISLMYNPFACDCNLLWFLNWTRSEHRKFQHYPEKYICDSPRDMNRKTLSEVDLSDYTCLLPLPASVTIICSLGIFLLILAATSLIYKWRWHIRYYMYLKKKKQGWDRQMAPNDISYDAYVIYSLSDIKWIKNELIINLENELDKKLYIRDRDSLAGAPIVDNVVNNMAVGRSVLVVLSNAMARDEQCQFELMFVQRQEEGQRNPIILVLLEEVQAANMTQSVYALVKMHSYISWSEERDAKELFWNRLQHSLQHAGLNTDQQQIADH